MKLLSKVIAVATGCMLAASAQAVTTTRSNAGPDCSDPIPREFTVTANEALKCLFSGTGNITGTNGSQPGDDLMVGAGWTLASADTTAGVTGIDASSGFLIIPAAYWSQYGTVAVGFKSGVGQFDPDWAIFSFAFNTSRVDWTLSSQGLSHVVYYGKGSPPPNIPVPEPTTLALLGLGLAGLGFARRRRT